MGSHERSRVLVLLLILAAALASYGVKASALNSNSLTLLVAPTINAFNPTSGAPGINVEIRGSAFVGVTDVTFNGTNARFNVINPGLIIATVPPGATSGPITVKNRDGISRSAANFSITNNDALTFGNFMPVNGPVGTTVTITGRGFLAVRAVQFNGTVAKFTVVSDTQLTANVPPGATTGPINLITTAGSARSMAVFTVTAGGRLPAIDSFSPVSAPVGATVIIRGSNFMDAVAVLFNGVNARFNVDNDMQITAIVPLGAAKGPIVVVTPAGPARSAMDFTLMMATDRTPKIFGFNPTGGGPDAQVTINGVNLSGATAVQFNGTDARFAVVSDGMIRTNVPMGASSGPITVTTPQGSARSGGNFIITTGGNPNSPLIVGFTPTGGLPGAVVMITGRNFTGATDVTFNGVRAMFTVVSNFSIMATVPQGAMRGPISVTTPAGTTRSPNDFFIAVNNGRIAGFAPKAAPVGTNVTILGLKFTGATAVLFNGVRADFTVVSDSTITTAVPPNATTGAITVMTPGGNVISMQPFSVTPAGSAILLADLDVDFGTASPGQTVTRTVTVRNTGGRALTVNSARLLLGQGVGFSTSTQPSALTLAAGQSMSFTVNFMPRAVSPNFLIGNVELQSDAGSANIFLRGRSIETTPPVVTLSAPMGGETLMAGQPFTIRFTGTDNDLLSGFLVSYSTDGGATFPFDIARVGPLSTDVIWNVPDALSSTQTRIRVMARDRSGNMDFAVSNVFVVQQPNANRPMLQVTVTFDPPPPGELSAPLNLRVQVRPPGSSTIIANAADGEEEEADPELLGYNVYRVPAPKEGEEMPDPDEIASDPANMVGSEPADSTSFDEMVSTDKGDNFVYSITSFFGGGQQSMSSEASGTDVPVIKNPVFKSGTIFFDAAGSNVKMGAQLIVDGVETYPVEVDSSGAFLTVNKKTKSTPGNLTFKKKVKKGTTVQLVVRNPDERVSVAVSFTR